MDSAAQLFALATARSGLHVVGQREYYSNIMGKHSYYKIRAAPKPIGGPAADVHLLATYDAETLVRHLWSEEVVPGGAVLYAKGDEDKTLDKMPNLDKRIKQELEEHLASQNEEVTAKALLEHAKARGVMVLGIPFDDMLDQLAEELDQPRAKMNILRNTLAVGASLGLLRLDASHLNDTVRHIFAGKSESIHTMNIRAAELAAEYAVENLPGYEHRLEPEEKPGDRVWVQGTQAVALAKMAAGCRFHTYYPISPATDEATYLEANPESDIVVVQTEDEIAAASMAIGAALTGARASTSTSGPGFCLMVEALGWAGICEAPIVVFDYQRGGPSTGLPTRTEQGDLQFALRFGHSDFPRFVMSPGDIQELFEDAVLAFDLAERYQTPVIVLPDKAMAGNSATVEPFATDGLKLDRGRLATDDGVAELSEEGRFPRFRLRDDGISTRTVLGQKDGIHWLTGDEHTEFGHITEDPVVRDTQMAKRLRKLEVAAEEIPADRQATLHGPADADVTIVSYGGTKHTILEALEDLADQGITANFLQYRILSPFPAASEEVLQGAEHLIVLEENATGQLRDLIAERTGIRIQGQALKTNGRPTMPHEVVDAVQRIQGGESKVVMTHGV